MIRDPIIPPLPPHPVASPPKGWTMLDMDGRFSLYAPPAAYHHPERGTDSYVGDIIGADFKLTFDYGLFSGGPDQRPPAPGVREERFVADRHPAVIRSGLTASGEIGIMLYVPNVHCGRLIIGIRCDWDALQISGTARDAAAEATVKTMFRTLQFSPNPYE